MSLVREVVRDRGLMVVARGVPGLGGACDDYAVHYGENQCVELPFQNKPAPDGARWSGLTLEALLWVVLDRLAMFQQGPYPCEQNGWALEHVRSALRCLAERTDDRKRRGVEGTCAL
jgi:hypothetical protein